MSDGRPVAFEGAQSRIPSPGATSSVLTDPSTARPWFALRVRANFEKNAANYLLATGHEQFLPTYRCRTYWSDRAKWTDKILFPGYVFARFDADNWLPALKTPGVVEAVSFGGRPVPLDESEIAALRTLVSSGEPLFPRAFLQVGERVRVTRGPLAGLEGLLDRFEKDCRIVVSVTLLQRSVAAQLDAEWVTPLR